MKVYKVLGMWRAHKMVALTTDLLVRPSSQVRVPGKGQFDSIWGTSQSVGCRSTKSCLGA